MPAASSAPRILFVDDEPHVLSGLRRALGGLYRLETASSGEQGLATLAAAAGQPDGFAVIVSDMKMPGMNGAEFLGRAREFAPDALSIILSGQADLTSTVDAVNNASLFRFLIKPCNRNDLRRALDDALRQHQLVVAERELLERTLAGAVNVLTKVLSIANPAAFSRTDRILTLLRGAAPMLEVDDVWELQLAAMLSQVGGVAVPEEILQAVNDGRPLAPAERSMYATHPAVAASLVQDIPRLERVAAWIADQPVDAATAGYRIPRPRIPGDTDEKMLTARNLLFAAIAFLRALDAGTPVADIAVELRPLFGTSITAALSRAAQPLTPDGESREVDLAGLRPGMLLLRDVRSRSGAVLATRGETVSGASLLRLRNHAKITGVVEPIRVLVTGAVAAGSTA